MGVVRRSVSLDPTVAASLERAAKEEGVSFSTWLSRAAARQLRLRDGLRGVREWESEHGTLTPEEMAAGEVLLRRLLGRPGRRKQGRHP
jgi:hypothetical protein